MKRSKFLHLSSAMAIGSLIIPAEACKLPEPGKGPRNWAGNIIFSTDKVDQPKDVQELVGFIRKAERIKAQGTTHCFNRIADSKHELLATKQLDKIINIDKEKMTVTVEAGMKYGDLAPRLQEQGFALHNLASLPHISIGGSIATATHGSGVSNGNLATAVEAIEMVDASGSVVTLNREKDGDIFAGAVVGLGALGVLTKVTLKLQPSYEVKQFVYEHLPNEQLYRNFDSIMGAAYSVSLFTDWQQDSVNEVWVKALIGQADAFGVGREFFGGKPATRNMHPIAANDAVNCTPQMGEVGPWFERLPHFKMGFTPSSGVELQAEYFVPYEKGAEAMHAVSGLAKEIGPHLFISEIRSIAADDLWMSTAFARKSIAIHFTWKQETEAVMALLPRIEKVLEPFSPRPHWGKLFTIPRETLASRYPRIEDFRKLASKYDPSRKFVNDFLRDTIFG